MMSSEEERDPLGSFLDLVLGGGAGDQQHPVGVVDAADPLLAAVDAEGAVALVLGEGVQVGGVVAGVWLGQRHTEAQVAVHQRTQQLVALLFGAVLDQRHRAEDDVDDEEHVRARAAVGAQLLDDGGQFDDAHPLAAVFLGDGHAEKAGVGTVLPELGRPAFAVCHLPPVLVVVPLRDLPGGLFDEAQLLRFNESRVVGFRFRHAC
jgi:hypothetical protein